MDNVTEKRKIEAVSGEPGPDLMRKSAKGAYTLPTEATKLVHLTENENKLTRCASVADVPACNAPVMYREDKATQVAALFLNRAGGEMCYCRLLKLLYLADRQTLLTKGHPITYDMWVSMDQGPVLSKTYGLITQVVDHGANYWLSHIHTNQESVELVSDPGADSLSVAEESVVNEVFEANRNTDDTELGRMMRGLPEWEDPHGTSKCIPFERVLRVNNVPDEDIDGIMDAIGTQESTIHLYEYAR